MSSVQAVLLAFFVGIAAAQAPPDLPDDPAELLIPGVVPHTPPAPERVEDLAREIGMGLRCPVCQALSVADSTSPAAVNMQHRIQELVAAGYDRTQIEDYFVDKYDEWILLDPRHGGTNVIVWVGPLLAFGLGLVAAGTFLRKSEAVADHGVAAPPAGSDDPYASELLAEVDDD